MRRFYASPENFHDDAAGEIVLDAEQTRHLRDVLRLRAGDDVRVFDGEGNEFSCAIEEIAKRETRLKIVEQVKSSAALSKSALDLTLAVALLKGEKFDFVIQKAVELGVKRFVPLQTKRADVRLKDAREIEKKLGRWRKIIIEAAKQCGRAELMKIENAQSFGDFIKASSQPEKDEIFVLFSERGGARFSEIKTEKKMTAAIGAEGGWEDSEIETARNAGFQIVTLGGGGGTILRAETAAVAIAAILQHRFGDLN